MRRLVLAAAAAITLAAPAFAQDAENPPLLQPGWSFDGIFGTFDRAALQRGFQVYSEVCSACHSMNLLHYRDLAALGYDDAQIKAIAAQKQVTAGPNDQGEMFQRPAQPQDAFVPPYPNDEASRAAHNGALPPDLSLIVKARDGGPDYVYSILNGFTTPPADFKLNNGMNYNKYFSGNQIAMPQPLADDSVKFADGTPATLQQEAHDVVTFLTWASDPNMEARKETGVKVMLFLFVMAGIMYAAKRRLWSNLYHNADQGAPVAPRPHPEHNLPKTGAAHTA